MWRMPCTGVASSSVESMPTCVIGVWRRNSRGHCLPVDVCAAGDGTVKKVPFGCSLSKLGVGAPIEPGGQQLSAAMVGEYGDETCLD